MYKPTIATVYKLNNPSKIVSQWKYLILRSATMVHWVLLEKQLINRFPRTVANKINRFPRTVANKKYVYESIDICAMKIKFKEVWFSAL